MAAPNKLTIPISDDDELREYFSRKQPGDTCTLLIEATVDDQIGKSVTLSVKNVEIQDYDEEDLGTPEDENAGGLRGEDEEPGRSKIMGGGRQQVQDSYYEPTSIPPEPSKKSGRKTRPNQRSAANVAFAYGSGNSEQPSL